MEVAGKETRKWLRNFTKFEYFEVQLWDESRFLEKMSAQTGLCLYLIEEKKGRFLKNAVKQTTIFLTKLGKTKRKKIQKQKCFSDLDGPYDRM